MWEIRTVGSDLARAYAVGMASNAIAFCSFLSNKI